MRVWIADVAGKPVPDATVTSRRLVNSGADFPLSWDPYERLYSAQADDIGSYEIRVHRNGLESQQREVEVNVDGVDAVFVLGRQGLPFYFLGRVKVPFDIDDLIAVAVAQNEQRPFVDVAKSFGVDISSLGFTKVEVPEDVHRQRVHVFKVASNRASPIALFEEEALRWSAVIGVGAVVRFSGASVSFLTQEICLKLRPGAAMPATVSGNQLTVVRQLPYVENGWLLRGGSGSRQVNDICNLLADDPNVVWAEPNLFATAVPHASGPDTFLNDQPHHEIIDTYGAWATTKGSSVRIAVIDSDGFKTSHEDLAPNLERSWNFSSVPMSASVEDLANLPTLEHGTKCAGIAVASMDNALGVAGVAGKAKFWAIRRGGTVVDHADMFVWCSGQNPGSARAGFPSPPSPGTDVISCSWGVEASATPATIEGAFNTLASGGRGGKGCVVVFSVGNTTEDFSLVYPWASYGNNIAVGASTIPIPLRNGAGALNVQAEKRVSTSNWGPNLDVCAPGGEKIISTTNNRTLTTFPAVSPSPATYDFYGTEYAFHGETSCACPQVAGVAALMLAVNGSLTASEVKQIIRDTAVKIDRVNAGYDAYGFSKWYGYGRINAAGAVGAAYNRLGLWRKLTRALNPIWIPDWFFGRRG